MLNNDEKVSISMYNTNPLGVFTTIMMRKFLFQSIIQIQLVYLQQYIVMQQYIIIMMREFLFVRYNYILNCINTNYNTNQLGIFCSNNDQKVSKYKLNYHDVFTLDVFIGFTASTMRIRPMNYSETLSSRWITRDTCLGPCR